MSRDKMQGERSIVDLFNDSTLTVRKAQFGMDESPEFGKKKNPFKKKDDEDDRADAKDTREDNKDDREDAKDVREEEVGGEAVPEASVEEGASLVDEILKTLEKGEGEESGEKLSEEKGEGEATEAEELKTELVEDITDMTESFDLKPAAVVDLLTTVLQDEGSKEELVKEIGKEVSARRARKAALKRK